MQLPGFRGFEYHRDAHNRPQLLRRAPINTQDGLIYGSRILSAYRMSKQRLVPMRAATSRHETRRQLPVKKSGGSSLSPLKPKPLQLPSTEILVTRPNSTGQVARKHPSIYGSPSTNRDNGHGAEGRYLQLCLPSSLLPPILHPRPSSFLSSSSPNLCLSFSSLSPTRRGDYPPRPPFTIAIFGTFVYTFESTSVRLLGTELKTQIHSASTWQHCRTPRLEGWTKSPLRTKKRRGISPDLIPRVSTRTFSLLQPLVSLSNRKSSLYPV